MKVVVRLFASLREEVGTSRLELDFEREPTLALVVGRVLGDRPIEGLLVAVNSELLGGRDIEAVRLKDGDVVDLMPPSSGG